MDRLWGEVVTMMADGAREQAHSALTGDVSHREFLRRYLEIAPFDLVIG